MFRSFKKILPLIKPESTQPLHAGEIYYLWEGLTSANKFVAVLETYLMNTEDKELHVMISGLIQVTYLTKIKQLENVLKNEGFTAPPRSASKTSQGSPGSGQEVKLTDDEVLVNLTIWGQVHMEFNSDAVVSCTRESVRKVFTDILFNDIKAYKLLLNYGNKRNAIIPSPPATSKDNSLNMEEVGLLWATLRYRLLSIQNLEIYIASTNDKDLLELLNRGLNKIVIPQMERTETILKDEGITVPPRPIRRIYQGKPGFTNKIKMGDDEIIGELTVAFQVAIKHHVRGLVSSLRKDVQKLFEDFLSTEIEEYQKVIALAKSRHALSNPPVVPSRK
jgi:hypothetical protein